MRTTMVLVTTASQQNRRPATSPGAITPIGESIGAVATATCWLVRITGSAAKPRRSTISRTDWKKPPLSSFCIGPPDRALRRPAEPHHVPQHIGAP